MGHACLGKLDHRPEHPDRYQYSRAHRSALGRRGYDYRIEERRDRLPQDDMYDVDSLTSKKWGNTIPATNPAHARLGEEVKTMRSSKVPAQVPARTATNVSSWTSRTEIRNLSKKMDSACPKRWATDGPPSVKLHGVLSVIRRRPFSMILTARPRKLLTSTRTGSPQLPVFPHVLHSRSGKQMAQGWGRLVGSGRVLRVKQGVM